MQLHSRFILLCLLYPLFMALQWLPRKKHGLRVYQAKKSPPLQGILCTLQEVELWADGSDVDDKLLSFMKSTPFEKQCLFVFTYTHTGSGGDRPTAEANLYGSSMDIRWYDSNESMARTMDLRWQPLVATARFDPAVVKSVYVHGLQVAPHKFSVIPGVVEDKASAFAVLRGIDAYKNKNEGKLEALTSISIDEADHVRLLRALAYLPHLEELKANGVHWTPQSLELLGKIVSLKRLSLGGKHWSDSNNFEYKDLLFLQKLSNLESLDLSNTAVDGKRGMFAIFEEDGESESERRAKRSKAFQEGMEMILKLPKLRDLFLGAQMYPEGTKLLTNHPTLAGIHGVRQLSLDAVQILADSKLAPQLESFSFEGAQENAKSIMAQIAKFVNLTHLKMDSNSLDDVAMMELAPLVHLQQLYLPHFSKVGAEGLAVLHHLPNIKVLSLGYCQGNIGNGLYDHIRHLDLTHLDLRAIKELTSAELLPVLGTGSTAGEDRVEQFPNLVDLNLRYAENVDANQLIKEVNFGKLKYLNVFSTKTDIPTSMMLKAQVTKALGLDSVEFYKEDTPFHVMPPLPGSAQQQSTTSAPQPRTSAGDRD